MKMTITEKAREMLDKNLGGTKKFLRVIITQGGCAGLTYGAEIDEDLRKDDSIVFTQDEIRVVSDKESSPYLDGLVIDYSDSLISGGLRFTNPHSRSTCGCGASFSLTGFPVKQDGNCGGLRK